MPENYICLTLHSKCNGGLVSGKKQKHTHHVDCNEWMQNAANWTCFGATNYRTHLQCIMHLHLKPSIQHIGKITTLQQRFPDGFEPKMLWLQCIPLRLLGHRYEPYLFIFKIKKNTKHQKENNEPCTLFMNSLDITNIQGGSAAVTIQSLICYCRRWFQQFCFKIGSINSCQSNSFGTKSLKPEWCCCSTAASAILGKQDLN